MSEKPQGSEEKELPIEELKDFELEEDPTFPNRVRNSLNRHLLVGDSLEFSLDVFQKTMWEYLKTIVEVWPSLKDDKPE